VFDAGADGDGPADGLVAEHGADLLRQVPGHQVARADAAGERAQEDFAVGEQLGAGRGAHLEVVGADDDGLTHHGVPFLSPIPPGHSFGPGSASTFATTSPLASITKMASLCWSPFFVWQRKATNLSSGDGKNGPKKYETCPGLSSRI